MNNILKITLCCLVCVSCFNKERPNYQYMASTDMYEPVGYETYYKSPKGGFRNGMEAQLPAKNTIKRGWMPYQYQDTNEGYEMAKANLKNPFLADSISLKDNMQKGASLFNIYCISCHGDKGDGSGILSKKKKIMGIPSYKDRAITQGSIYHVIYYGKNTMGSFASQLTEQERWQVALYVEKLRENLIK